MRSPELTIDTRRGYFSTRMDRLIRTSAKGVGAVVAAGTFLLAGCSAGTEVSTTAPNATTGTMAGSPDTVPQGTVPPITGTTRPPETVGTLPPETVPVVPVTPEQTIDPKEKFVDTTIGDLKLYMPVDDYFDQGYTVKPACGSMQAVTLDGPQGEFTGQTNPNGLIVGLSTTSPSIKSAAGLGVGSSEAEVRSVFGSHVFESQVDSASGPLTVLGPSNIYELGQAMFYTIDDSQVIVMSLEQSGYDPFLGC